MVNKKSIKVITKYKWLLYTIMMFVLSLGILGCGNRTDLSVSDGDGVGMEVMEVETTTEEVTEAKTTEAITEQATDNVDVDTAQQLADDLDVTIDDVSTVTDTEAVTEEFTEAADTNEPEILYVKDLKNLKNTEHFLKSAIEHIFSGSVNKKGNASGYHYDGIADSDGWIVEGTKTKPDKNGVYTGKVMVSNIAKSGNKGYSTFYPEDMTPQEVIDAINNAYEDRELESGNTYIGDSGRGFMIEMYLDDNDKIISAFPVKE